MIPIVFGQKLLENTWNRTHKESSTQRNPKGCQGNQEKLDIPVAQTFHQIYDDPSESSSLSSSSEDEPPNMPPAAALDSSSSSSSSTAAAAGASPAAPAAGAAAAAKAEGSAKISLTLPKFSHE